MPINILNIWPSGICQAEKKFLLSPPAQAVIPVQDYLGLGKEARMNFPSTLGHNWEWRVRKEQLTHDLAGYIAHMTGLSYRRRIDPPKKEETDEGKAEK